MRRNKGRSVGQMSERFRKIMGVPTDRERFRARKTKTKQRRLQKAVPALFFYFLA
jgi:hypothetical protein